jgi:aspartyl-tRNA synthetase
VNRSLSQDLVFLPLRDSSGTTQLVYHAEHCSPEIKMTIQKLATESVVCVEGIVHKRPDGTINQQLPTGGIEVEIQHIYCLNPASPQLPFWPSQPQLVSLSPFPPPSKKKKKNDD